MNSDIEFGVLLPTMGHHASPRAIRRLATTAEECGFDAVWAGDHITFPADIPDEYPFSPSGESPFHISQDAYDVFTVLSYLAGITNTVDIGSNTCIVPYRHPVALARNALSVEALSDGRFDFGVGSGWLRTEFEVLDVPFEERGSRTDEFLSLFDRIRKAGELSFDGPHHSFQETGFVRRQNRVDPRFGLAAGPAQHSDAWDSSATAGRYSGTVRRTSPPRGNEYWTRGLISTARESRKSPSRGRSTGSDHDLDASRPLIGDSATVAADIESYLDAGVTRIVIDFYTTDIEGTT